MFLVYFFTVNFVIEVLRWKLNHYTAESNVCSGIFMVVEKEEKEEVRPRFFKVLPNVLMA